MDKTNSKNKKDKFTKLLHDIQHTAIEITILIGTIFLLYNLIKLMLSY